MTYDILNEGDKLELREILTEKEIADGAKPAVYVSQIFEEDEDGDLRVAMPILKGRLVPLMKGEKYDAFFFVGKFLYNARVEIIDRFKSENIYTMKIRLDTELKKFQRRQYYRLEKSIDILYAPLSDEDYQTIIETRQFPESMKRINYFEAASTSDISGGGMRFVGHTKVDAGKKVMVIFDVAGKSRQMKFRLPATVISSSLIPERAGRYEHRIEFENISREYREILIHYIFEEERRLRHNTR